MTIHVYSSFTIEEGSMHLVKNSERLDSNDMQMWGIAYTENSGFYEDQSTIHYGEFEEMRNTFSLMRTNNAYLLFQEMIAVSPIGENTVPQNQASRVQALIRNKNKKPSIESLLTFGFEIEGLYPNDSAHELVIRAICSRYNCHYGSDGSIRNEVGMKSCEITTPVMENNPDDRKKIYEMIAELKKADLIVNSSCGGHIHIGVQNIEGIDRVTKRTIFFAYAIENMSHIENAIYSVNGGNKRKNGDYAKNVTGLIQYMNRSHYTFLGSNGRYYGLNTESWAEHKTLEYRLFVGSVDPEIWMSNLKIAVKITAMSIRGKELPVFRINQWEQCAAFFGIDSKIYAVRKALFIKRSTRIQRTKAGNLTIEQIQLWKECISILKRSDPEDNAGNRNTLWLELRKIVIEAKTIIKSNTGAFYIHLEDSVVRIQVRDTIVYFQTIEGYRENLLDRLALINEGESE